ncbi:histidine kinase dimerization/phospho-acceptor domain-containing protein, partial [Intestinimonas sp. HCP28S3_D6]|uniref:histidine kinase dimerization/phospho-acceptor domain-containing protein n=1 Tax=Intestinimonas sp. HCP28S3_D6 TaxID=3438942 RepID=UPI003F886AC3
MNNLIRCISRRLGIKLLTVAAIAFAFAWLGNYLVANTVATWFFYDTRFDAYWDKQSASAVEDFQKYVTERGLSMQEALTDTKWNKENSDIILFTGPAFLYEDGKSVLDEEDEYEPIICSDGFIYATSYSPGNTYFFWWDTAGMVIGILLFLGIVIPFTVYTMHRIKKLYQQVLLSAQSGRNSRIEVSGRDEIAELGNEIESMRMSLLALLENEERMREESEQLVASLSHDIRTPLTKLTGYLEILIHKKELTETQYEIYLEKASEKAHQMKILTDELFHEFVTDRRNEHDYLQEVIDGGQFLNQLLYEECSELEEDGFLVGQLPMFGSGCFCCLHIEDIRRAFDNIFSKEPLNKSLYPVSTQCISRHLRLVKVISVQNSHYLSA